jgi:hypothetical protein
MSRMLNVTQRLDAAAQAVRDYAASEATVALVAWIDAATHAYKEELVDVDSSGVISLQSSIKQLVALRALALGARNSDGLI